MIDAEILLRYNGFIREFNKSDVIVVQGEEAKYYHQIVEGKVKMSNLNDEGKEFIQGIFSDGESFGEPPLFIGINYPTSAIALTHSSIILIAKEDFFRLLKKEKECCYELLQFLCYRLYYKSIMAPKISCNDSKKRVLTLLGFVKNRQRGKGELRIELTRQQIADMTGLRVETVIRAIKELEKKHLLRIERGKLFI